MADISSITTTGGTTYTLKDATARSGLNGKEEASNKVTALSAQSTDTQYPSAKCVYDNCVRTSDAQYIGGNKTFTGNVDFTYADSVKVSLPYANDSPTTKFYVDRLVITAVSDKQDTISDLSTIRSGAALGATSLQDEDILNSVQSTATDKALSANMGKELQDAISNLQSRGRYLSTWNSTTGLPTTDPTTLPYDYRTGDYFIVSAVGSSNLRPAGTQYTGAASTNAETAEVAVNDSYLYDGSAWILLKNTGASVTFANLAGQPSDNSNLASALNAKENVSNKVTAISSSSTNAQYPSAKCVYDELATKQDLIPANTYESYGSVSTHNASTSAHSSLFGTKLSISAQSAVPSTPTSLNTLYNAGLYGLKGVPIANGAPTASPFYGAVLVNPYNQTSGKTSTSFASQLAFTTGDFSGNNRGIWYRDSVASAWNAWRKVAFQDEIPSVSDKEDKSNKVTSISSSSTDTQYPSAKCVYDLVGNVESALAALL